MNPNMPPPTPEFGERRMFIDTQIIAILDQPTQDPPSTPYIRFTQTQAINIGIIQPHERPILGKDYGSVQISNGITETAADVQIIPTGDRIDSKVTVSELLSSLLKLNKDDLAKITYHR